MERDSIGTSVNGWFDISTHTLTWSVTGYSLSLASRSLNFNSHAHVERDDIVLLCNGLYDISTHTLTWSVTKVLFTSCDIWFISTHTLTWSVTVIVTSVGAFSTISTHTLTWSVTGLNGIKITSGKFQLTRSRGA